MMFDASICWSLHVIEDNEIDSSISLTFLKNRYDIGCLLLLYTGEQEEILKIKVTGLYIPEKIAVTLCYCNIISCITVIIQNV